MIIQEARGSTMSSQKARSSTMSSQEAKGSIMRGRGDNDIFRAKINALCESGSKS